MTVHSREASLALAPYSMKFDGLNNFTFVNL